MRILGKTARFGAIALAALFIGLSLFGIFGAWFVSRKATDVARKGFGVVETSVGVVDAGVRRVDDLIATSRTEVRQAADTITGVGAQAVSNSPVLNALNERLETSLSPRIAQMRQVLAQMRDAVGNLSNAVSLVSSLPMMTERAPRLAAMDETFDRLEGISVDAAELRSTLRALVLEEKINVPSKAVAALKALAQRIDTRLGEVQAKVQSVRADVDALQDGLDKRKSRLLFLFNLLALLSTLMLAWILYTQVVVIQHHWARVQNSGE
jgi:chromosome segregation ATPase